MIYFSLFALIAGAAITAQASMNAQLGVLLHNPLLATCIAFASGLVFTLTGAFLLSSRLPTQESINTVPFYLWFSGGLLSAVAITTFYWLIPKMGIGPMMTFALSGQLLLAIIAGHFGWFQLPATPLSGIKLIGIGALILGIILVNKG